MKYLSGISLIIGIVVIIQEFAYIKTTSLAWVIIGLAIAVILLAISQIAGKKA